jgi:RNA polymerase sigma factor for flagellar operon FliA
MYNLKGRCHSKTQFEDHIDLVKKIAYQLKSKLPANIEEDDLIQAGMIGLLDALNRYEDNQQAQFETYASLRIRGAMLDELRTLDWLPRTVRENMRKIENAILDLQKHHGRNPTELEIADYLKLPLKQYHKFLSDNSGHQLLYLEDFVTEEDGDSYLDRYQTEKTDNPLESLLELGFQDALAQAIDALPSKERLMMGLYYEQELNLKEIGAVLDVSESRVSQIHSQAISRLRTLLKEQKWIGEV